MSKKKRSSSSGQRANNALSNGFYARDAVLPWESRDDFETLHANLCAELTPRGALEEACVLDVAHNVWQKQRIRKMWQAAAYSDPFVLDLIQSGKKSWTGIRRYLRKESRNARTLTAPMREIFSELSCQAQEAASQLSGADAKDAHQRLELAITAIDKRVLPLLLKLELGPSAEQTFQNAYSPANVEPILRVEALIDGRIDKALGRLANLKAFKTIQAQPALPTNR